MSKTLETKRKILNLLKKREMTITGLSEELGLSTATISQHMEELQRMGAIEKIDNEHFKKLKYYRLNESAPIPARYVLGAVVAILILGSIIYFYGAGAVSNIYQGQPVTPRSSTPAAAPNQTSATLVTAPGNQPGNSTAASSPPPAGGGSFACPLFFYYINGNVTGYSGFRLFNISSGNYTYRDYVLGTGSSGNLNITERITDVLAEPSGFNYTRQHYISFSRQGVRANNLNSSAQEVNTSIAPAGYNATPNKTINAIIAIRVNSTAPEATYAVRIDGPCGPGVQPFLITVGSKPYNGTVNFSSTYQ